MPGILFLNRDAFTFSRSSTIIFAIYRIAQRVNGTIRAVIGVRRPHQPPSLPGVLATDHDVAEGRQMNAKVFAAVAVSRSDLRIGWHRALRAVARRGFVLAMRGRDRTN
jgi:hypothetical protein